MATGVGGHDADAALVKTAGRFSRSDLAGNGAWLFYASGGFSRSGAPRRLCGFVTAPIAIVRLGKRRRCAHGGNGYEHCCGE